ncbi:MAG: hypothetical protein AAFY60_21630, partial [Myxococcota bacterium]
RLCDMNLDRADGGVEVVELFIRTNPDGEYFIATGSPERVPDWVPPQVILEKPFRSRLLLSRLRQARSFE